jgi:hypothetical protein
MDEWLTRARDAVADAGGVPREELELTSADMRALLEVARIAAHDSGNRVNAPLLCYLIGRAQGRGADLDALVAAVPESTS